CWPHAWVYFWPIRRTILSDPPPGAVGMMMRIGFVGKLGAAAIAPPETNNNEIPGTIIPALEVFCMDPPSALSGANFPLYPTLSPDRKGKIHGVARHLVTSSPASPAVRYRPASRSTAPWPSR